MGVDLPDVFFHDGHYYREQDGHWQVSLTGGGGWRISASGDIPDEVLRARGPKHSPAKAANAGPGR